MFASFTDKADLTPYACEGARIDLDAINSPLAYGAERSNAMDFSEYDRIDDFELNEILWRAVKGEDAPLAPRRPPGDRLPDRPPQVKFQVIEPNPTPGERLSKGGRRASSFLKFDSQPSRSAGYDRPETRGPSDL